MVDGNLEKYIEEEIIPRYRNFDAAHRENHVRSVISQSLQFAAIYGVDENIAYTAAAYHDTGLAMDRKTHHLESGKIIRGDKRLCEWLNPEQIELAAQAAEDHRASSDHEPRHIYSRITAEADRLIDPMVVIQRTVQFGFDHYPELDIEGHWQRTVEHLHEKYADGGYLKLWIPESPNAERLEALRKIIRDNDKGVVTEGSEKTLLRDIFEKNFYICMNLK